MHIPSVNSESLTGLLLQIDPKALELIKTLDGTTLAFDKLELNANGRMLLEVARKTDSNPLGKNNPLNQINLPLNAASKLSDIISSQSVQSQSMQSQSLQAAISLKNSQIILKLAGSSTPPSLTELVFQQAKLIAPGQLWLNQPTNLSSSVTSQPDLLALTTTAQANASQTELSHSSPQQILAKSISSLLKQKPIENPALSQGLNRLTQSNQTLQRQIFSLFPVEKPPADPFQTNSALSGSSQINLTSEASPGSSLRATVHSLVGLLDNQSLQWPKMLSDQNSLLNRVEELGQLINKISQQLEFSAQNRTLRLNDRINQSGLFFEANQQGLQDQNKQQTSRQTALTRRLPVNATGTGKHKEGTNPDLKAIFFQLRSQIEQLQSQLSKSSAPVKAADYFTNLLQSSELLARLMTLAESNQPLLNQLKEYGVSLDKNLLAVLNRALASVAAESAARTAAGQPDSPQTQASSPTHRNQDSPPLPGQASLLKPGQEPLLLSAKQSGLSVEKLFNQPLLLQKLLTQTHSEAANMKLLMEQRNLLQDMLSETSQLLNRVETNQLLSLKQDPVLNPQFFLDLPIFQQGKFESFELLFENREHQEQSKQGKRWTVTIRFDLEPLGPMFARVSLKNNRISTQFFAQDEITTQLLNDHIDTLKNSFISAGLDIDEVKGQKGRVPDTLLANQEHSVDVKV